MFEFHGWATIRVDDRDDPDLAVMRHREEEAVARLRAAIERAEDAFSLIEIRRPGNGLIVLLARSSDQLLRARRQVELLRIRT